MVNRPDEPEEILAFGNLERRSRLLPGGIRRPGTAAIVAGIVIGGLALAVIMLALRDVIPNAQTRVTKLTQRPMTTDVLVASSVSFPLRGTSGAQLLVRYLRTDDAPAAIWATLGASGLPRDTYYTATAGDCVNGRPRMLTSVSSIPDPQTDLLILLLDNVPASVSTVIWIKVTSARDADLGGARGSFLMPGAEGRAIPAPPGRPICP